MGWIILYYIGASEFQPVQLRVVDGSNNIF